MTGPQVKVLRRCFQPRTVARPPGMTNVTAASELLKPYDARLMRCYPVSTRINHVANDEEEFSEPAQPAEIQNSLFS
jgi:hypothetical protein